MVAPWQETATRVVVEFKKGSQGAQRRVLLSHNPQTVPQQLYGRISPEVWAGFLNDVHYLASVHPYTAAPTANDMCSWLGGCLCVVCIGFGIFNPDGGDYSLWLNQVHQVIERHQPYFMQGGANLSIQSVHANYWIQVDINPMMAVGAPVPTGMPAPPYGYDQPGKY